nr:MFS transporter [Nakamurella flavida]
MRGPVVSVSAVTGPISGDLALSGAALGLLTSLPVLCFGLLAPAASAAIGRLGLDRSVLLALALLAAGLGVRSSGGYVTALIGTALIGAGITVGNVATPVIIGRDFRGQVAMVTGAYTAIMNVGSMAALILSPGLTATFGWRIALAAWLVPAVLAAVLWTFLLVRRRTRPAAVERTVRPGPAGEPAPPAPPTAPLWRRPLTWLLTLAFAAQAFSYYGLTAWLPKLLADTRGLSEGSAGLASSLFQVFAIVGAFGMPVIINRRGPLPGMIALGFFWLSVPLGLLFAPGLFPLWASFGGIAQGSAFTLVFTVVVVRTSTQRENRRLSSIVQTFGYVLAATGPSVIGGLHDATGGWTVPLLGLTASLAVLITAGVIACRGIGPQKARS